MVKLSSIKANPNNPRIIRDHKFKQLVSSIKDFPKMMALRPMVVDAKGMVLGGNMRLKALQELKFKEVPEEWIKKASDFTSEELKQFIILDNVSFGDWQWDDLAKNWDADQLEAWGVEIPNFSPTEPLEPSEYNDQLQWYLNIKCTNEKQCQSLYEKFTKQGLEVKIVT